MIRNVPSAAPATGFPPAPQWRGSLTTGEYDPNRLLKQGVWAYFLLLIFEGALRKWVLPGLAAPLLVVREPLALWLVAKAWQRGLLPSTPYLAGMVLIGIAGTFSALLLGHGNIPVTIYGARILLLHFPLLFAIGGILDREDVLKMGRASLWIAIPMTVLIALQFYSPQSAWVNRGVGGDMEGAGFGGALGYFRPPATFSFTNGTTLFYSFTACFIFYFWVNLKGVNRPVLVAATVGLLAAIPLSISRGLLLQVAVSLVFLIIAILRKPQYIGRVLGAGIVAVFALILLSKTPVFQTATEVLFTRFDEAGEVEGGLKGTLGNRFLGGLLEALAQSTDQPFFGYGIGMGTNAGSTLLTGTREFLISEGEWARTIGELGPLMGLAVVFIRLGLSANVALGSYRRLVLGDMLPWMLLSCGLLLLAQGGWAQPTSLGFCTLLPGLLLASLRSAELQAEGSIPAAHIQDGHAAAHYPKPALPS